jgi:hypothetical protein
MSVPDRPFQPSLMFEGKASNLWNVASEMCFTQVGSSLIAKIRQRWRYLPGTNTLAYYEDS